MTKLEKKARRYYYKKFKKEILESVKMRTEFREVYVAAPDLENATIAYKVNHYTVFPRIEGSQCHFQRENDAILSNAPSFGTDTKLTKTETVTRSVMLSHLSMDGETITIKMAPDPVSTKTEMEND